MNSKGKCSGCGREHDDAKIQLDWKPDWGRCSVCFKPKQHDPEVVAMTMAAEISPYLRGPETYRISEAAFNELVDVLGHKAPDGSPTSMLHIGGFRFAKMDKPKESNVVYVHSTFVDLPPERVLDGAKKHELTTVAIVGWLPNGDEYYAMSSPDAGTVLLLLEKFKHALVTAPMEKKP